MSSEIFSHVVGVAIFFICFKKRGKNHDGTRAKHTALTIAELLQSLKRYVGLESKQEDVHTRWTVVLEGVIASSGNLDSPNVALQISSRALMVFWSAIIQGFGWVDAQQNKVGMTNLHQACHDHMQLWSGCFFFLPIFLPLHCPSLPYLLVLLLIVLTLCSPFVSSLVLLPQPRPHSLAYDS